MDYDRSPGDTPEARPPPLSEETPLAPPAAPADRPAAARLPHGGDPLRPAAGTPVHAGGPPAGEGRGSIGATNVARVGGPVLGLATLAADLLKALAARLGRRRGRGAVAGGARGRGSCRGPGGTPSLPTHRFFAEAAEGYAASAPAGFSGSAPRAVLCATAGLPRSPAQISRRASVTGRYPRPPGRRCRVCGQYAAGRAGSWTAAAGAALAAVLIFVRHAGNIRRLAAGTEPVFRFGRGR